MNISEVATEKLLMIANKISNQKHMSAIKNAFSALMPVIITGAFCTLITNVVLSTTTTGISLAKVNGFAWLEYLTPIFSAANYATLNFFTMGAVVLIGLELGKKNGVNHYTAAIIAMCSFVACLPTFVNFTQADGVVVAINNVIGKDYTAARGLFLGMIIALISVEIFSAIVKSGKLKITMPESVPSNVATSFNVLFPFMVTIILMAAINFGVTKLTGLNLYDIIYTMLQKPLEAVMQGLPGLLILMLVSQLFWIIGIHGNQIIKPVREPLLNAAILANTDLVQQGVTELSKLNIINMSFWDVYMSIGGSGVTIGLVVAIFVFSRREDYRGIAKLSAAPAIFNINETMTFGLPIMLNPIMAIPFVITPLITGTIAYVLTAIGFADVLVYAIPWTTPPILSAWLASGGSLTAVITQVICIAVSILIYIPFVMMANKQLNPYADTDLDNKEAMTK
ncbi:PTS transporter subunit EIIC [Clostridium sp. AL.422]|uniref:PTS sugar transporter subunit IIC n=1 Tax=Clostridium TaxID=1485 RepID=UPI00293DA44A|nr:MULTISPECIES: PTS transporter subunit EIIC [unclassified Clostridium]MDV4149431.1 PTS transporter subunit EIIC [Clostridium sp. AL.422]